VSQPQRWHLAESAVTLQHIDEGKAVSYELALPWGKLYESYWMWGAV